MDQSEASIHLDLALTVAAASLWALSHSSLSSLGGDHKVCQLFLIDFRTFYFDVNTSCHIILLIGGSTGYGVKGIKRLLN